MQQLRQSLRQYLATHQTTHTAATAAAATTDGTAVAERHSSSRLVSNSDGGSGGSPRVSSLPSRRPNAGPKALASHGAGRARTQQLRDAMRRFVGANESSAPAAAAAASASAVAAAAAIPADAHHVDDTISRPQRARKKTARDAPNIATWSSGESVSAANDSHVSGRSSRSSRRLSSVQESVRRFLEAPSAAATHRPSGEALSLLERAAQMEPGARRIDELTRQLWSGVEGAVHGRSSPSDPPPFRLLSAVLCEMTAQASPGEGDAATALVKRYTSRTQSLPHSLCWHLDVFHAYFDALLAAAQQQQPQRRNQARVQERCAAGADAIWSRLVARGVEPSSATFRRLMQIHMFCASSASIRRLHPLYARMAAVGLAFSADDFSVLIRTALVAHAHGCGRSVDLPSCPRDGEPLDALELVALRWASTAASAGLFLRLDGDLEPLLFDLHRRKLLGWRNDKPALKRLAEWDAMSDSEKRAAPPAIFPRLHIALVHAQLVAQADRVMAEYVALGLQRSWTIDTVNAWLACYAKEGARGQRHAAERVWQWMTQQQQQQPPLRPTPDTYVEMMRVMMLEGDSAAAARIESLWLEMGSADGPAGQVLRFRAVHYGRLIRTARLHWLAEQAALWGERAAAAGVADKLEKAARGVLDHLSVWSAVGPPTRMTDPLPPLHSTLAASSSFADPIIDAHAHDSHADDDCTSVIHTTTDPHATDCILSDADAGATDGADQVQI